jgi:hypothetical protein
MQSTTRILTAIVLALGSAPLLAMGCGGSGSGGTQGAGGTPTGSAGTGGVLTGTGTGGAAATGSSSSGSSSVTSASSSSGAGGTDTPDAGPKCPYTGPPLIDPTVFGMCTPTCAGAHCLPAALVPAADTAELAACTTSSGPGYCAPDTFIESLGNGLPPTCTSVAGSEGRCLSTCLPSIQAEAALLPQDVCASGEVCAPCFNPVAANPSAPTGACSLACDKPADPPTILTCPWTGPPVIDPTTLPMCDNGGCTGAHCIPAADVPASVQSQLAPCNNNTGFCAPDPIISTGDNFIPTSCDPFPGSGAAGRCLSTCLAAVQAEATGGTLVQTTCTTGQLCVPCNDPFTGVTTGACSLGCDMPPATPFTFPTCCNDGSGTLTGTCVPSAQVPSSEQSEVNQSGNGNSSPCPGGAASYLCVPDEYLPAPYNTVPLQAATAPSSAAARASASASTTPIWASSTKTAARPITSAFRAPASSGSRARRGAPSSARSDDAAAARSVSSSGA